MFKNILNNKSGLTLMEVLIVVLILGGSATLFFTKVRNTNSEIKEAVRQFGVLTRDLHSRAKLSNSTFRLVLDMGEGGEENKDSHKYWVESASGSRLASKESLTSPFKKDGEDKDDEDAPTSQFTPDARFGKKAKKLPRGVFFEDVEVKQLGEAITSGVVYIHFRPEGFVDEAAIHLKYNDNLRWTVSIHPLTGRSFINNEYVELSEFDEN